VTLLRSALSNRRIAQLLLAAAASSLGYWAFTIVLALYAYREGGAGAVALALTVRSVLGALAAPYAALLGDRHARRTVLLVSSGLRAAALVAMTLAALAGAPLVVVILLGAVVVAGGSGYRPAQTALLAEVARTPAELAAGNVCVTSIEAAGYLVGSILSGVLAALGGLDTSFAVCAVPMVIAMVALAGLPGGAREAEDETATGLIADLLAGIRTVLGERDIRLLTGVYSCDAVIQGAADVLLVVAAIEVLDIGEDGVGWLNAAWGIGGVAGGAAAMLLLHRGRLASALIAGLLLGGLPLSAVAIWPQPGVAYLLLVVVGVGFALSEIALLTLTQRLASDDVLARVFGVRETVEVIATAAGGILAAVLVSALGNRGAIVATGLVLPVVALTILHRARGFEAGAQVPEAAFARLRGLPLFAPLPLAMVETLSLRLARGRYPAGTPIVRQGEPGRTFYVIDGGEVDVHADGAFRRREVPGEFFGEIALLRDVPRTATVTAATDVETLEMRREDFLEGIGAHARSAGIAEAVAAERLRA
jgi:predicted MFS family arabinose efflux permease